MRTPWRSSKAAGSTGQVQIGTLVQVGDVWRVIDLPQTVGDGQADATPSGFFFQAAMTDRSETAAAGPSEASQKLLADLESLDREAARRPRPRSRPEYTGRRADLLGADRGGRQDAPTIGPCGCGSWPT